MALLNTYLSLEELQSGEGVIDKNKGLRIPPIIFSLDLPYSIFIVDTLERWRVSGGNQLSQNTTPFGQIKDVAFHTPSRLEITGKINQNPEKVEANIELFSGFTLRDISIALGLGSTLIESIQGGDLLVDNIIYNSYSQAAVTIRRLSDNNRPVYFAGFPVDFTNFFYTNYYSISQWSVAQWTFNSVEGFQVMAFNLSCEETVVPLDTLSTTRRLVEKYIL